MKQNSNKEQMSLLSENSLKGSAINPYRCEAKALRVLGESSIGLKEKEKSEREASLFPAPISLEEKDKKEREDDFDDDDNLDVRTSCGREATDAKCSSSRVRQGGSEREGWV